MSSFLLPSAQVRQRLLSATRRMSCLSAHMAQPSTVATATMSNRTVDLSQPMPCKEIKIPVPWGHIAAKEWGVRNGRRILGLHGWQDNCGTFDPLVPYLPRDIHLVTIDLPGHGLSSHKPEGEFYHIFDFVTDVRRVVNYLQWNTNNNNNNKEDDSTFSMIAHSMGSAVAVSYAACFPTEIKKLIMLDSVKIVTRSVKTLTKRAASGINMLLKLENRDRVAEAKRDILFEDAVELLVDATYGSVSEDSARVLLKRGSRPSGNGSRITFNRDPRLRVDSVPGVTYEQFLEIARSVRSELLIIVATQGINSASGTPEEINEALQTYRDNCKSFELVEVDGSHHVHLNSPELVAPHIVQFLNS